MAGTNVRKSSQLKNVIGREKDARSIGGRAPRTDETRRGTDGSECEKEDETGPETDPEIGEKDKERDQGTDPETYQEIGETCEMDTERDPETGGRAVAPATTKGAEIRASGQYDEVAVGVETKDEGARPDIFEKKPSCMRTACAHNLFCT